jgi:hypothetical protein
VNSARLQLPTWQVVLPEKILQFRPLDYVRTDLFALAGLLSILAQVRYAAQCLCIWQLSLPTYV